MLQGQQIPLYGKVLEFPFFRKSSDGNVWGRGGGGRLAGENRQVHLTLEQEQTEDC